MLNARGNVYSQKHTHFNTTSPEFWSFSWHEIGVFDVPATIGKTLSIPKKTGTKASKTFFFISMDRLHFGENKSKRTLIYRC